MRRVAILSILLAFTCAAPPAHAKHRKKHTLIDQLAEKAEAKLDAALVPAPKDEEACFSPDEPCDIKLIKFVGSAKKSIDVAIYDLNLDELAHKLLIQSRSIPVRVVVDERQAKGEHSLVPMLLKAGLPIRYGRQRGIMHNKFVIVDGQTVEVGSFNYTHHASRANQENQLYLAKPSIVERYRKRFEKIWSEAKVPRMPRG
jgi:phosphatidylserine/phosphatidylglycerophosphate/cardiolipin synthase-like enzyme